MASEAREALNCWHCGRAMPNLPQPIGRREECPHCAASLHLCRMCGFYDTNVSKDCREPVADEVADKEHANFCDYFRPLAGLTAGRDTAAADSRAKLEALFSANGPPAGPTSPPSASPRTAAPRTAAPRPAAPADSDAEAARHKLESLFDDDGENC